MSPVLESIDHNHINVSNRTAAEIWYRDFLGLVRDLDGNSFEITTYDHGAFNQLRGQ